MLTLIPLVILGFLCSLGFAQPPNAAIGLSAHQNLFKIWTDRGSGADRDISIYRPVNVPSEYRSLGDVAVPAPEYPGIAFIGKKIKNDAFQDPLHFYPIWNDRGSGADWDVTFYRPVCSDGYVPLGDVAVRNHNTYPNKHDAVCVKRAYVVLGKWKFIWNDRGSGADRDVSVFEAIPRDSQGLGVLAMSAVTHHGAMDKPAYVLNGYLVF